MRCAGIRDIEQALIRREGDAVRPIEIVGDDADFARGGVDPEDVTALELHLRAVPLVIGLDAVGGIGEPDGIVRFDDDVVRAVESLALVAIDDGDDRRRRTRCG